MKHNPIMAAILSTLALAVGAPDMANPALRAPSAITQAKDPKKKARKDTTVTLLGGAQPDPNLYVDKWNRIRNRDRDLRRMVEKALFEKLGVRVSARQYKMGKRTFQRAIMEQARLEAEARKAAETAPPETSPES